MELCEDGYADVVESEEKKVLPWCKISSRKFLSTGWNYESYF